ncbi:MAG: nucleotidyl transferase AbiEii/AbiGii toxin family protein [Firmicutes bacterium]|nr:nucleotidyl transferase AbiEii/AbiGii toxin family protein [Bacillota bacterium]
MKSLLEMLNERKTSENNEQLLQVKICQEIFLAKAKDVGADSWFSLKGGITLYELTHGDRGFTRDIDFDMIHYSISEAQIRKFFKEVNQSKLFSNIKLEIVGQIEELHHAHYQGKNVKVDFIDNTGTVFSLSFDIGVSTHEVLVPTMQQFHLIANQSNVSLRIDPPEQMIVEKLSGFLKFGARSTRTKDIYDIYWLLTNQNINRNLLIELMTSYLTISHLFKDLGASIDKLVALFRLKSFGRKLSVTRNWLEVSHQEVCDTVVDWLMSCKFKLEKMGTNDAFFLYDIFSTDEYELNFAENNTSVDEWKERIASYFLDKESYIIKNSNGVSIGWLMYHLDNGLCYLDIIVLLDHERNKGYGSAVMSYLFNQLPKKIVSIKLDVQKRNIAAVGFYQKLGFKIIGEEAQPVGDSKQVYYKLEKNI